MAEIVTPPDGYGKRRRPLRSRWEEEVWTSQSIPDGCRVLLLLIAARHMDARGYFSVPRPQLAAELGREERRVSERLEQAVAAKLLDRVRRGQKGVVPVYRAMLPDAFSGTKNSPLNLTENPPAERPIRPVQRAGKRPTLSSPTALHVSRRGSAVENFELLSSKKEVRSAPESGRRGGDPESVGRVIEALFGRRAG